MVPWVIAAVLLGALGLALWPPGADTAEPTRPQPIAQPPRVDPPPPEMREEAVPVQHEPVPEEAQPDPPPATEEPTPRRASTVPVTISAMPWAEVTLDGRALGQTPQRALPVRTGRHTLLLSCPPLGREVRYTFEAEAGQPIRLHGDLSAEPPIVRRVRGGDQN